MRQEELTRLREEIAALTGGSPSLKRARQAEFLLVMFGPEEVSRLEAAGYTLTPLGPRRWGVEPPGRFYCPEETAEPAWQPGAAYQLWRMVKSHPTDADPAAARALVKALEADDAEACCRALLRLCAQRLREQKPLPGFLAPWLGRALQAAGKPLQ